MLKIKIHLRRLVLSLFFIMMISMQCRTFGQGKCLIVSDIHLNPFYSNDTTYTINTQLRDTLYRADVGQWEDLLNKNTSHLTITKALRGLDASYPLLANALDAMYARRDSVGVIVIAGDFLWHEFYKKGMKVPFASKEQEQLLKTKTMQFIALLFQNRFHGVPIIPTLGNNDSDNGDYESQSPEFLGEFADAWKLNENFAVNRDTFKTQGYYAANWHQTKFVVLNTTWVSNDTVRTDHTTYTAQANKMLDWLDTTLSASKQPAWIISHIPPGADGYNIAKNLRPTAKLMWNPACSLRMEGILKKQYPQIACYIASHTHTNEYRLVYDDQLQMPLAVIRIVPSIGLNHYNNPSFEIARLDSSNRVNTESTWYMDIAKGDTTWQVLKPIPQLQPFSPTALYKYFGLFTPDNMPAEYKSFFNVGAPGDVLPDIFKADVFHF